MYAKLVFKAASLQASRMSSSVIVVPLLTVALLTIPTLFIVTPMTATPAGPVETAGRGVLPFTYRSSTFTFAVTESFPEDLPVEDGCEDVLGLLA